MGFVYYESIKRDLKTKPMYECRCDERLKTKAEEFTRFGYTGCMITCAFQNSSTDASASTVRGKGGRVVLKVRDISHLSHGEIVLVTNDDDIVA